MIKTTILKGMYKKQDVFISRISMISTDIPFDFIRLQFPVRLAFVITINKSQGHSFIICDIDLENPCFSHDHRYFTCSHVEKLSALFIYASNNKTKMSCNIQHCNKQNDDVMWYAIPNKTFNCFDCLLEHRSYNQNQIVNKIHWNLLWF